MMPNLHSPVSHNAFNLQQYLKYINVCCVQQMPLCALYIHNLLLYVT